MIDAIQLIVTRAIRFGVTLCLIAIGASGVPSVAIADEGDSLGALWWQHAQSIPAAQNPIADETGAYCGIGQRGDTWFLHGSFGAMGAPYLITRDCSAPAGRRFFLPIVNWICLPFPGETIKENVQACRDANDLTDTAELTIDGVPASGLIKRRAQRNPFDVTFPENNVYGVPPGSYVAVHDGYWALLPNLSPGDHTIEIVGRISAFDFYIDVTYNLTVTEAVPIDPPPP
ncbi:MAG: hypothetical protein OER22_15110 [Gammaproteobacteria bacterium]|nr:hypothetical protein [Gammaproteobacteria bacterium]MDH3553939.1 hypothetical protein [Gammaproteobacteria bacterium]